MQKLLERAATFGYSQLQVFDSASVHVALMCMEDHVRQGFARQKSVVLMGTCLEFGRAELAIWQGPFREGESYDRIIRVPFHCHSGGVEVGGPDETEVQPIALIPGHYGLVVAQRVIDDLNERIDVIFEPRYEPLERSEIILQDEGLDPPAELIEVAELL